MISEDLRGMLRPIEELHPHPENPKVGDVEAIAVSLERYGQVRPILARADGEIVAGAHTWRAAKSLGWAEVAANRFYGTEAEARAYRLADNALADRGHYDNTLLIANLEALHAELGDDLEAATGYTKDALDSLLAEVSGNRDDPRGHLLELSKVTTDEPEREVAHGEVYRLGGVLTGHVLVVADVFTEHETWGPWLARARTDADTGEAPPVMFVPYPTPHLPFSEAGGKYRLVMVAPEPYLCGKVLDAYAAIEGADTVTKVSQ